MALQPTLLRLETEILDRVKTHATATGRTQADLFRDWIIRGLTADERTIRSEERSAG